VIPPSHRKPLTLMRNDQIWVVIIAFCGDGAANTTPASVDSVLASIYGYYAFYPSSSGPTAFSFYPLESNL